MPLEYTNSVLHRTTDFDSFHMLPRSVLTLGMSSWTGMLNKNIHSFPRLIKDFNFGAVVVRTHIEYLRPYDFFSGEAFTVQNQMWVSDDKRLLISDISFIDEDGEPFVSLGMVGRAVKVDTTSWGAVPTTIESPVLDHFGSGDYYPGKVERLVEKRLKQLKGLEPLVEHQVDKRIYRHECEAADQWSYVEIGKNAANAREELLLQAVPAEQERLGEVRSLLNKPLDNVNTLIKRPLFLFDDYRIHSALYQAEDGYSVVHRYLSDSGRAREHAVVIETYKA